MFHIQLKAVFGFKGEGKNFLSGKNSLDRDTGQLVLIIWRKKIP